MKRPKQTNPCHDDDQNNEQIISESAYIGCPLHQAFSDVEDPVLLQSKTVFLFPAVHDGLQILAHILVEFLKNQASLLDTQKLVHHMLRVNLTPNTRTFTKTHLHTTDKLKSPSLASALERIAQDQMINFRYLIPNSPTKPQFLRHPSVKSTITIHTQIPHPSQATQPLLPPHSKASSPCLCTPPQQRLSEPQPL